MSFGRLGDQHEGWVQAADLEGGAVALADQVQLVDDEQRHVADRLPLLRVLPPPGDLVPLLRRRDRDVRLHIHANVVVDADKNYCTSHTGRMYLVTQTTCLRLLAEQCHAE